MKKQEIIGYLVLDANGPARAYPNVPNESRYVTYKNSRRAASLFPDEKTAKRAKRVLYARYWSYAVFGSGGGDAIVRAVDGDRVNCSLEATPSGQTRALGWEDLARSLRICAVVHDAFPATDEAAR